MAKHDGGIIVLDDDDDELTVGSSSARPWTFPSTSKAQPWTPPSPSNARPRPLKSALTSLPLTPPSTARRVIIRSISNAHPGTPPSTSNDRTGTQSSTSTARLRTLRFVSNDHPGTPSSTSNDRTEALRSISDDQSGTPPSTASDRTETLQSISNARPGTPPSTQSARPDTPTSTSKSRRRKDHSTSSRFLTSETNGSGMMPMPDKEVVQSTLKATNENLFKEFMEFCGSQTTEHPEVMSFLQGRYQKASPDFLASTEFRNVIGRCLTRVQNKKSKVYVYINELCTVLKANSEKKKVVLSSTPSAKHKSPRQPRGDPAADEPDERPEEEDGDSAAADDTDEAAQEARRKGSKRQIRYLENLLSVYTAEIRKLQEKELDLAELGSEDSSYIQENRLKRKMIRIFQKLCELKSCCSRTGRVIEQRIPYHGTRYPEVNRRIQKFINKPDNFPDYGDILKVIEKASVRYSLDLTKRQMQSMASDAFRDVGNRLQERRHLDMVYNFGNHLTDKYKAGTDPALLDPVLARRLRENRNVALTHLDEVVKKYAELQDETEDEDRKRRKGTSTNQPRTQPGSGRGTKVSAASTSASASNEQGSDEEDEEEEEEDEDSSDTDIEEELQKCEEMSEPEEEAAEDEPVPEVTEGDQRMDNPSEPSPFSSAGDEVDDDEDDDEDDDDEEEDDDEDGSLKNDDQRDQDDDPGALSKPNTPEAGVTENNDKTMAREGDPEEALESETPESCATETVEPMELESDRTEVSKRDHLSSSLTDNEDMEAVAQPHSLVSSGIEIVENKDTMDYEIDSVPQYTSEGFAVEIELLHVPESDSPQWTTMEPSDSPTQSTVPTNPLIKSQVTGKTSVVTERLQTSFRISRGPSLGSTGAQSSLESSDPAMVSQESGGSQSSLASQPTSPTSLSSRGPCGFLVSPKSAAPEMVLQEPAASAASSEPHLTSQTSQMSFPGPSRSQPASPRTSLLKSLSQPAEALRSQAASPVPATSRSSPFSPRPSDSVPCGPLSQSSLESEVALQVPSGCPVACPRPPVSEAVSPGYLVASTKTPESETAGPKLSLSCVASPAPPWSETTSPKPSGSRVSSSISSASGTPGLQETSPGLTGSPFSAASRSQTMSPRPPGSCIMSPGPGASRAVSPGPGASRAVSPGPGGSQATSPGPGGSRAASPMPSGQLPPRSRASSPGCSQSPPSAASGSLEAAPPQSPAASPESSRSPIHSAASRFQFASSGLGESELCSRTNSSSSSDCLVDLDNDMVSSGSHNSHGAGITDVPLLAPGDSGLCADMQHLSDACKVTSSRYMGTKKQSKDDCVLIEQTVIPHAELLQSKAALREPKNEAIPLLPAPSLSASGTRLNFPSDAPTVVPMRRKRTLSGTLKKLQLKRDTSSQNGRTCSMTSVNGSPGDSFLQSNHQSKRVRREESYLNRFAEVHSIDSDDESNLSLDLHVSCVSPDSSSPRVDSTQDDSPFISIVSSSPLASRQQSKIRKINAATQCDPEEVIVLSDSD